MSIDRSKLVERARKLFAMANDTSSPEEAAIAARRVKSMMDREGIKAEEIRNAAPSDLGKEYVNRNFKCPPAWHRVLAYGVGVYMECICMTTREGVVFKGMKQDVAVAALTMDYLESAMERQLRSAISASLPEDKRRFSSNFRKGFASSMQEVMKKIAKERREDQGPGSGVGALVLVKSAKVEEAFGRNKPRSVKMRASSAGGYYEGIIAAAKTSLSSQMGNTKRTAIK